MLPSLLWAKENKGLKHPILENLTNDISWVDKWYEHSLCFIPEFLHDYFLHKLEEFDVGKIVNIEPLINWNSKLN